MTMPLPYKEPILKSITSDSKLLIGVGCSFTSGQGSYSARTQAQYDWNIRIDMQSDEFIVEGYKNCWLNQICEKYMPEWTPVNLGQAGAGNRQAVKELYTFDADSKNKIEDAKEIIVVFMLTGMERWSVVKKGYSWMCQDHWMTAWPTDDIERDHPLNNFWKAYKKEVYGEDQIYFETFLHIKEAQMWCKANNAKLILTPAFDGGYMNEIFEKWIGFNPGFEFLYPEGRLSHWHNLLEKDGFDWGTQNGGYWEKLNFTPEYPKGTKHTSRCCHPNQVGHEVIADLIYNEIKERKYV